MRSIAVVILSAALCAPLSSWAQPKAAPAAPAKDAALAPAKISSIEWMKGYWVGEGFGGTVETIMTPAKAGVMIGTFRHVKADGRAGFYELCGIEEYEGSLRFIVKHFHPSWVGWEEKDHAFQAKLSRVGKDEWQFGNMLVKRTGKDAFTMELSIVNKDGGAPRKETLKFKRQAL
jgi:hypothetical protein